LLAAKLLVDVLPIAHGLYGHNVFFGQGMVDHPENTDAQLPQPAATTT